ncbi:MAG: type II toxin-antitoxin system HicA family toxin [Parcubacteria group bacterium]|nr:type II toxin-antitoxin system HicA family toxin [Parcubacteria group bacterium]
MSIVPILKAKEVVQFLLKLGFKVVSQKGSHVKLEHVLDKTRRVVVPLHAKDLKRGTLMGILKQSKVSIDEFLKILGKF